jgi:hypothetical protein
VRRALAAAALLLACAAEAAAQPGVRVRPDRDDVPRDTAARDTAGARPVVRDSIFEALLRLEGYAPVEYEGDSARFDNRERTLRLRGNPAVTRGDQRLTATDSIVYREERDFVEA